MFSHSSRHKAPCASFLCLCIGLVALAVPRFARGEGAPSQSIDIAPRVALLEVAVPTTADHERLVALGMDVVAERPGRWAHLIGWPGDEATLRAAGFRVSILDTDYARTLTRAAGATLKVAPPDAAGVPPFGSGSMGGFYTLAEVNTWLDSMSTHDANGIISPVATIGASRQGRAVRAIRIANEAAPDHSRPRVLFTALTHAREPGGMQTLLYLIDRLVSGYGSDPDLTYLVDQREIWFVPVVNPDGYVKNENDFVSSGGVFGLWRKNLRDNNNNLIVDGNDGVDINRNFGYQWGFDNNGSSNLISSQTYRGPSAFSEPETKVLRDFCVLHGFRTANNFHTFFETTLYPWSYNGLICPDGPFYIRMVDDMMRDAHYSYGVSVQILYPVNGDANDWMYGEQTTKAKVLAVTTETGTQNDNFWPPASRILPLAFQNFRSCVVLAYSAGVYVHAIDATLVSTDGWLHPNGNAGVSVTLRNDGLDATNGAVTMTASVATPGMTLTDASSTYPALAAGASATPAGNDRLTLHADASVPSGTIVPLALEIRDAGSYVRHDSTFVTVGQPVTVFADAASGGLGNWTPTGTWGIQNVGGNPLFSDSPAGNYAGVSDTRLTLNPPLDLSGGNKAYLKFNTQWAIEGGYDFARVEVSTNGGGSWTAVAGRLTRPGHGTTGGYGGGTQTLGVPGYDMTKRFLAPETIDLSAYAGVSNLRLRFRLTSDNGTEDDGFMFDDLQVLVYPQDVTDVTGEPRPLPALALAAAGANPFRDSARLVASFPAPTPFRAAVYAVDGSLVRELGLGVAAAGPHEIVWDGRDTRGHAVASGTYLVRLDAGTRSVTQRLVRLR